MSWGMVLWCGIGGFCAGKDLFMVWGFGDISNGVGSLHLPDGVLCTKAAMAAAELHLVFM